MCNDNSGYILYELLHFYGKRGRIEINQKDQTKNQESHSENAEWVAYF